MKKNIVIVLLISILCILIGIDIGYVIKSKQDKEFPTQLEITGQEINKAEEKKNDSTENNETVKESNVIIDYDKSLLNIDLEETLKSKGILPEKLNVIYNYKYDGTYNKDKALNNQSFKYNNKTIYIGCNGELFFNKASSNNVSCSNSYAEDEEMYINFSVAYLNGYYISLNGGETDGYYFQLYDSNLNRQIAEGLDYISSDKTTIYYATGRCGGKRSDGSLGDVDEVYGFNTQTKSTSYLFNLDHNAGWGC